MCVCVSTLHKYTLYERQKTMFNQLYHYLLYVHKYARAPTKISLTNYLVCTSPRGPLDSPRIQGHTRRISFPGSPPGSGRSPGGRGRGNIRVQTWGVNVCRETSETDLWWAWVWLVFFKRVFIDFSIYIDTKFQHEISCQSHNRESNLGKPQMILTFILSVISNEP